MLTSFASLRSQWGSMESHPTGRRDGSQREPFHLFRPTVYLRTR